MKSLSKKIVALLMALIMAMPAILVAPAFANAKDAVSDDLLAGKYLTNDVTTGIETNSNVVWDSTNNAAYFSGSNSYLNLSGTPMSDVRTSTGYAISFDVMFKDTPNYWGRILDFNNGIAGGNSGSKYLFVNGADGNSSHNHLQTELKDGSSQYATVTDKNTLLSNSAFHNVVVIFNSSTKKTQIWVESNGVYTNYATSGSESKITNIDYFGDFTNYWIGKSSWASDPYFKGYIRNLYLFKKTMTRNEVTKYVSAEQKEATKLVFYDTCDEGVTTNASGSYASADSTTVDGRSGVIQTDGTHVYMSKNNYIHQDSDGGYEISFWYRPTSLTGTMINIGHNTEYWNYDSMCIDGWNHKKYFNVCADGNLHYCWSVENEGDSYADFSNVWNGKLQTNQWQYIRILVTPEGKRDKIDFYVDNQLASIKHTDDAVKNDGSGNKSIADGLSINEYFAQKDFHVFYGCEFGHGFGKNAGAIDDVFITTVEKEVTSGTYGCELLVNGINGTTDFVNTDVYWDSTVGGARFNGTSSKLTLNFNPLEKYSSTTGFSISMDVRTDNVNNLGTPFVIKKDATHYIAMNSGSNKAWQRGAFLYNNNWSSGEVGGVWTADFASNVNYFYNGSNHEPVNNQWYSISIVYDGAMLSYYVDGVLKATTKSDYNINSRNISNVNSVISGLTSCTIGYGDGLSGANNGNSFGGYFTGYIRNIRIAPFDVRKISSLTVAGSDYITAQSAYIGKMTAVKIGNNLGYAYTKLDTAYDDYVEAKAAYDAYTYGSGSAATLATKVSDLITSTNLIATYSRSGSTVPSWEHSGTGYQTEGTTYKNILYWYSVKTDTSPEAKDSVSVGWEHDRARMDTGSVRVYVYYASQLAILYDGVSTPIIPIMSGAVRHDSTKTRNVWGVYPAASTATVYTDAPDSPDFMIPDWWRSSTSSEQFNWNYRGASSTNRHGYNQATGQYGNQGTHWSENVAGNCIKWYNLLFYRGVPNANSAVVNITPKWYLAASDQKNKNSEYDNQLINSNTTIDIVNFKKLLNAMGDYQAQMIDLDLTRYSEGGLYDLFHNSAMTTAFNYNPQDDFGAATNKDLYSGYLTACENHINTYAADITAAKTSGYAGKIDGHNTLKAVLRYGLDERTPTVHADHWTEVTPNSFSFESAIAAATTSFGSASFSAFNTAYTTAKGKFNGTYASKNFSNVSAAANAAGSLLSTFFALDTKDINPPSVSTGKYLGKNDTVTVTDEEGGCTMTYEVTFNDSTSHSGSVSSGGTINIFNGNTDKTSAELVVTATKEDKVNTTTVNYTFIQAPRFTSDSAGNTTVTQGVYPLYVNEIINDANVYAYSNTSAADATRVIQYSYNGNDWHNVSNGGVVFVFDPDNTSKQFPGSANILLKEEITKDGRTCSSEISTFTVIQENTFTIYSNKAESTSFYDASSTISIEDTTHYTDDIIFYIQKENGDFILDGNLPKKYTYSKGNGFALSGNNAFEDAETVLAENQITIYAYSRSADEAGYSNRVSKVLTNVSSHNDLIYHESFDGTVSGSTYNSADPKGVSINLNTAGAIVASAGDKQGFSQKNEVGTTGDLRKNALKISGTHNKYSVDPRVSLSTNPFADSINKAFAKENGVTISFWRAIQDKSSDTKHTLDNMTKWRDVVSFMNSNDNFGSDHYGYFMINSTGVSSYATSSSNHIDIGVSEYDQTYFTASARSGYWQHVAVTINPKAATVADAIKVYLNGVPHDVSTPITAGGEYSGASVSKAVGDLLNFITDEDNYLYFGHDNFWQQTDYDENLFIDDVRFYTKPLTQKEVWESYYDENSDTPTAEGYYPSVTHDPTTITVYKLKTAYTTQDNGTKAVGSLVGQEFIDYYNVPASDYDVEYYSYGTGLQIYHSTNNKDWEIVGDSQGRVAYQNRDMFVMDNGSGGYTSMYYRDALADVCNSINSAADDKEEKNYAGNLIWAPHVSYNLRQDKWMMYVSVSFWGDSKSAIISLPSIDGTPLHFKARNSNNTQAYSVLVRSNGRPNAIDPCVYYGHNEDGSIQYSSVYMAYGAWSQDSTRDKDIYVIQLNSWGDALSGQSAPKAYGDASWATSGTPICSSQPDGHEPDFHTGEGAFIIYNKPYYYLYVAYGQNEFNYTTRVFRSTSPTSGFVDYTDVAATSTTAVHGTQIMAPHYVPGDNYIYMSTGHDSIYKAYNNSGEAITIHSAHARPVSNEANGYKELPDIAMVTRQDSFIGNITITHPMFYTQTGWPISMPEQFNGTDTSNNITASALDGLYKAITLHDIIDEDLDYSSKVKPSGFTTNWDNSLKLYFSHETATTGVIYGNGSNGFMPIDLTYELTYSGNTTQIAIKQGNTLKAEGVVAMHNGEPELSYFNIEATDEYGHPTRAGSTIWATKQSNLETPANFANLDDAYNRGDALLRQLANEAPKYTTASVNALISAVEAAQANSTKSAAKKRLTPVDPEQDTLDAQEEAIEDAISGLQTTPAGTDTSAYEAAVDKFDSIINNIDNDIYDATDFNAETAATAASNVVNDDASYKGSTIYTIANNASQAEIEAATTEITSYMTSTYKKYKIYLEKGAFAVSADAKLKGGIVEESGSDEFGIYSYTGYANTEIVATANVDTAWYMSYTSAGTARSKQYQNYGKTFTNPLIGNMHIFAAQRTNETPNKVTIRRHYSDTSSAPVQSIDFVNSSYELPEPIAIAYYEFAGYTYGGSPASDEITGIDSDIEIVANYRRVNNADAFTVKVSSINGNGDIFNDSYEYNTKLKASDPNAYAWVINPATENEAIYYIGSNMTFYVCDNVEIKAISKESYDNGGYVVPNVNITHAIVSEVEFNSQTYNKLSIVGQVVGNDVSIVEYGVLVGKAEGGNVLNDGDLILQNTGVHDNFKVLRAKSTKIVGANQFSIGVTTNITGEYKYRSYLIYQDENEELVTVYSDVLIGTIA